jgi:hypothetical protein
MPGRPQMASTWARTTPGCHWTASTGPGRHLDPDGQAGPQVLPLESTAA